MDSQKPPTSPVEPRLDASRPTTAGVGDLWQMDMAASEKQAIRESLKDIELSALIDILEAQSLALMKASAPKGTVNAVRFGWQHVFEALYPGVPFTLTAFAGAAR